MEKKINYNRDLRKNLNRVYTKYENYLDKNIIKEGTLIGILYNTILTEDCILPEILIPLFYTVGYSDLYKSLKYKLENNLVSEGSIYSYTNYFNLLKTAKDYNSLVKIYKNNPELIGFIFDAMIEFYDLNAYDKIIRIKMLSEEERKKLQNINTINYQDIENYDIDVTIDFMEQKIGQGIKIDSKYNLIVDSSIFIESLSKIGDSSYKKLIRELIYIDIKYCYFSIMQVSDIIDELDEEERDKITRMKQRIKMFKSTNIENYIDNLEHYQIIGMMESFIDYSHYYGYMKNDIDNYFKNKANKKFKNKLKELKI